MTNSVIIELCHTPCLCATLQIHGKNADSGILTRCDRNHKYTIRRNSALSTSNAIADGREAVNREARAGGRLA